MTSGYLLDSNHIGLAVTPDSVVRRRIGDLRAAGAKMGTCVPVLCEIEVGIQQVKRPAAYRHNLEGLLRQIRVWPVDLRTARLYVEIHRDLKRHGRVLSQVDIMLAALARQMKLTLVTSDKDFTAIPDLRTEDWLSQPGKKGGG